MPKTFLITPLAGVRAALIDHDVRGILSIRDPDGDARADAQIGPVDVPVLKLRFHDVDIVSAWETSVHRVRGAQADDVANALTFLAGLPAGPVLVHCEAGISRSPSLAFGLSAVLESRRATLTPERITALAAQTQRDAIVWDPNHKILRLCEALIPNGDGDLVSAATLATQNPLSAAPFFSW